MAMFQTPYSWESLATKRHGAVGPGGLMERSCTEILSRVLVEPLRLPKPHKLACFILPLAVPRLRCLMHSGERRKLFWHMRTGFLNCVEQPKWRGLPPNRGREGHF